MVSSISRNYFSGLTSGLDTDSLIQATIKSESSAKYSLERKRTTLSYQQSMLQDVNLKLYNLQTKASDLLLSKTFKTKDVTSTNDRLVSAKATTGADVGSYNVKVKQIATATTVTAPANSKQVTLDGRLSSQSFSTKPTSGNITIDGVIFNVDVENDTLQSVIDKINNDGNTNVVASYEDDRISLKRVANKNGTEFGEDTLTAPIGIGSAADTSNLLKITGMVSGNVTEESYRKPTNLSGDFFNFDTSSTLDDDVNGSFTITIGDNEPITISYHGNTKQLDGEGNPVLDGEGNPIYNTDAETYDDIINKIKTAIGSENVSIVDEEGGTGNKKLVLKNDDGAEIKFSDDAGGILTRLGVNNKSAEGEEVAYSVITGSKPVSGVNPNMVISNAGFSNTVSAGTFSINGVKFEISDPSAITVNSVLDMINKNEKVGVTAQFDPTSGNFILTSRETGNQSIAIGSNDDTSNFLEAIGLKGATQNIGQNAIYSIEGMFGGADQVSQTNFIADAVEGVTFELRGVTEGSGETIDIKTDSESAMETIKSFIESYNEVTELIYGYLTEERQKDSSENYLEALTDDERDELDSDTLDAYESAYKIGLLRGDPTLRSIRSQMRSAMSSIVKNVDSAFNSLSDLGITTGTIGSSFTETMVGKLSITDEDKLKEALEKNPNEVASLFNADNGIARQLKNVLNSFTASDGILTKRVGRSDSTVGNEFSTQIDSLNSQISAQQARLAAREEQLLKQYTQLETAMAQFQSQSSAIANLQN